MTLCSTVTFLQASWKKIQQGRMSPRARSSVEPFERQWLGHGCLTVTNHDVMLQTSFKMDAFDENVGVISASLKSAGKFQMRLIQTVDGTLQAQSDTHSSDHKTKIFHSYRSMPGTHSSAKSVIFTIQDTHSSDHKPSVHAGHPLFS